MPNRGFSRTGDALAELTHEKLVRTNPGSAARCGPQICEANGSNNVGNSIAPGTGGSDRTDRQAEGACCGAGHQQGEDWALHAVTIAAGAMIHALQRAGGTAGGLHFTDIGVESWFS